MLNGEILQLFPPHLVGVGLQIKTLATLAYWLYENVVTSTIHVRFHMIYSQITCRKYMNGDVAEGGVEFIWAVGLDLIKKAIDYDAYINLLHNI